MDTSRLPVERWLALDASQQVQDRFQGFEDLLVALEPGVEALHQFDSRINGLSCGNHFVHDWTDGPADLLAEDLANVIEHGQPGRKTRPQPELGPSGSQRAPRVSRR